MRPTINLGSIRGVRIGMNWTVAIITLLITLSLAGTILPGQIEGLSAGAALVGGVIGAIGLLGSILAHELGHALVGRANGMKIEQITLWIFGGVAQLEGEMPDPKVEAKVAGVGPVISLVLGVIGLAGAAVIGTDNLPGVLIGWLGLVNIVLGLFNLLPGTPLDGGRLLHAYLWRRNGNRHRATVSASRAGKVIGYLLIAAGVFEFFAGSTVGGLWTGTIGWILVGSASAEAQHSAIRTDLEGLRVADIAERTDPLPDWLVVDEFIERYVATGDNRVFLLTGFDGRTSGYITLSRLGDVPADERLTRPVRDFALAIDAVPVVAADSSARDMLMTGNAMAGEMVAIVQDAEGRPSGVITRDGLTNAVQRARLLRSSWKRAQ